VRLLIFGDVSDSIELPVAIWLFQILIILFPMLLFQSYFRKKIMSTKQRNWVFGILCGISILFCMSAPVSINNGYILDFRYVPLILAFLYGGYRMGLTLSVLVISYRLFIIGLDGLFFILIVMAFLLITLRFTHIKYHLLPYKDKVIYASTLIALTLIIFIIGTQTLSGFPDVSSKLGLWTIFIFLNILTLYTTIYINESLKEMEYVHFEVAEYEKMHLVNHFSISIAHQLQKPLNTIQDTLENIKRDTSLSNQSHFDINTSLVEVAEAQKIIGNYLLLAGTDDHKNDCLNVHEEIEYILKCIQTFALIHQVEIVYHPSFDKDLYSKGNKSQFHQALLNIMKNGIEAIKGDGKLEIGVHEMLESIYIVIEDNGIGMPKEMLNLLGNPLKSQKENGTGFGTMIAYNIIQSMGGKIEVTSEKGKGTTFSIILPKARKVQPPI
jgi:two-component system, sporulation sensor kinase B